MVLLSFKFSNEATESFLVVPYFLHSFLVSHPLITLSGGYKEVHQAVFPISDRRKRVLFFLIWKSFAQLEAWFNF